MTFVGILIALLLERLLGHFDGWGRPRVFLPAMRTAHTLLPALLTRSPVWPLLVVLLPTWAVWWVRGQLEDPIVELVFSAGVLLLCLGPRDLAEDVHALLAARAQGDATRASALARALQRGPNPGESHRSLLGALFIQSHEKLFGVLLWFFVLGPAGALAYRLASRLPRFLDETQPDAPAAQAADGLHAVLAWAPGRVTALLYALAGSLDEGLSAWRQLLGQPEHAWRRQTWAVLAEVPAAALGSDTEEGAAVVPANLDAVMREVLRMQWRALLILLAGFTLVATGTLL